MILFVAISASVRIHNADTNITQWWNCHYGNKKYIKKQLTYKLIVLPGIH